MDIDTLQCVQLNKQQVPLVNQFYKQVYKKGLANKSEQIFVLRDKQIVCAARLKEVGGSQLLTGVACDPIYRHQGLASRLIECILKQTIDTIYCFPYPHLQIFYQQLGFQLLPIEELPNILAEQYRRYNQHKSLLCMAIAQQPH